MRVKWTKPYYLKKRTIVKNDELMDIETWGNPILINANIQPATSKVQAQMYGQELVYYKNMLYDGDIEIEVGDGICYGIDNTQDPNYIVQPIQDWSEHQMIVLKKDTNHG